MYSITTTKAIVLKSYDSGEKDVTLSLFTRDLGQIYAKVSGVRDLNSRHRFAVQEHSLSEISLVQGKNGWRITNTNFIKSYYFDLNKEKREERREKILRILSLVKRFYLGGEANEKVFEDLLIGFEDISNANTDKDIELCEAQIVANFLYDLGYVGSEPTQKSVNVTELRKIINEGIRTSGL
jgi:recombinational DNA repair protein (RecF pathway)